MGAFVHFCGIIFYGIYASGELQPWAEPTEEEQSHWKIAERPPYQETSIVSRLSICTINSNNIS